MKTTIEILKILPGRYEFRIYFFNDSEICASLPVEQLRRSAASVGLLIYFNSKALEPVEFEVISYANMPREINLEPKANYLMSLFAEVKKIGKVSWGLALEGATYKIDLGLVYDVQFSLNNYRSEMIKCSFAEN